MHFSAPSLLHGFVLFFVLWKVQCVCVCVKDIKHSLGRADGRLGETLPHFLKGHNVRERWGLGWKWGRRWLQSAWLEVGVWPGLGETWKITCLRALLRGSLCHMGSSSRNGLHQVLPKTWGGTVRCLLEAQQLPGGHFPFGGLSPFLLNWENFFLNHIWEHTLPPPPPLLPFLFEFEFRFT